MNPFASDNARTEFNREERHAHPDAATARDAAHRPNDAAPPPLAKILIDALDQSTAALHSGISLSAFNTTLERHRAREQCDEAVAQSLVADALAHVLTGERDRPQRWQPVARVVARTIWADQRGRVRIERLWAALRRPGSPADGVE